MRRPGRGSGTDRRTLLAAAGAFGLASLLPARRPAAGTLREVRLRATSRSWPLAGGTHPETPVWCYGDALHGPPIRVRQGDRLRVTLENRLDQETTIHWHGLRVPNAMDGVPHLTQPPVRPGESFTYEFECADAGTFWFHPHHRSYEQIGRGLAGALVVEERRPYPANRDIVWMLGDWRLRQDGTMVDDFGHMRDVSHAGRIGNTATINGRVPEDFAVRPGERIRLRLVNVANARIFALEFREHAPRIIALDGHPVAHHRPADGRIILAPGQRADLLLDLTREEGGRYSVVDSYYPRQTYRLVDIVYGDRPVPASFAGPFGVPPPELPPNPLSEPEPAEAARLDVLLGGGMMGGMTSAMLEGRETDLRSLLGRGYAWALNGIAGAHHGEAPLFELALGRSYILALVNDTAWPHPMHLHGHAFRVIARNGRPTTHREWRDTVLLEPREQVEIAFRADNPGDWMFHCHVLEHQAGGMTAVLRVRLQG
ncbi:MAG: multicopper oxidase family protein [Alphaproteobacteria bacterium]|nr:multicopper oxidase family protein [Alphaproteobacteria bacterium]